MWIMRKHVYTRGTVSLRDTTKIFSKGLHELADNFELEKGKQEYIRKWYLRKKKKLS